MAGKTLTNHFKRQENRVPTCLSVSDLSYMKVPNTQPMGERSSTTAKSTWISRKGEAKVLRSLPFLAVFEMHWFCNKLSKFSTNPESKLTYTVHSWGAFHGQLLICCIVEQNLALRLELWEIEYFLQLHTLKTQVPTGKCLSVEKSGLLAFFHISPNTVAPSESIRIGPLVIFDVEYLLRCRSHTPSSAM